MKYKVGDKTLLGEIEAVGLDDEQQIALYAIYTGKNKVWFSESAVDSITLPRDAILEEIIKERERQDEKWGYPQYNVLPEWGNILVEEVGEAIKEINVLHFRENDERREEHKQRLRQELIEVAAVAISFVRHIDDGVCRID